MVIHECRQLSIRRVDRVDPGQSKFLHQPVLQRPERSTRPLAQDTQLSRGDRAGLWKASNYSGLLLLGWLFEDLICRLPQAAAILKDPRFDKVLGRLGKVENHIGKELRAILTPAAVKPRTVRRGWREWCRWLSEPAQIWRGRRFAVTLPA
jgi:hypothetical protein